MHSHLGSGYRSGLLHLRDSAEETSQEIKNHPIFVG